MRLKRQLFRPGRWVERITTVPRLLARTSRPPFARSHAASAANEHLAVRPLSLRLAEHAGGAFSLLLSVVLLVAIVALLIAFVKELRSDTLVIEGFSAPPELVARGYTPAVIAENVLDEIRSIQKRAKSTRQPRIIESASDIPDIDVAHGALSMRAVVRYTRRMLALPDNSVSGEIVLMGQNLKANVRIRERDSVQIASVERADGSVQGFVKEIARSIVKVVDPVTLAITLFDEELKEPEHSFRETLSALEYALAHSPEDDDAWALMVVGNVRRAQNRFADAVTAYREAMRRSPAMPFAADNLAQALYFAGQLDEAAKMVPPQVPNPRQSAAELRERAWTLIVQNRFDEAYAFASAALAKMPNDLSARSAIVEALKELHRPSEALAHVDKMLSPIDRNAAQGFGPHYVELLIATGRPNEALSFAQGDASAHSDDASYAWALAMAFAANGRYADAVAAYQRASVVWPDYSPVLIGWGDALLALHRPQEALEKMTAAVNLDRTFGEAHAGLGRALLAAGKPADAAASFAKAWELDRHHAAVLRLWADTLDALGRPEEAAEKRKHADVVEQENARPLVAGK